ncbi:hypothetical protein EVAR_47292_1 [Eumeta japonica]|uniref:Uncharacterized protein n=1 Tax=Eumeta variegata TaxID=151549 RepID=A0A4C1YX20_EUMVA|nr:hypothetical protein EVAR_47292_1 [Eumeta japonica]
MLGIKTPSGRWATNRNNAETSKFFLALQTLSESLCTPLPREHVKLSTLDVSIAVVDGPEPHWAGVGGLRSNTPELK